MAVGGWWDDRNVARDASILTSLITAQGRDLQRAIACGGGVIYGKPSVIFSIELFGECYHASQNLALLLIFKVGHHTTDDMLFVVPGCVNLDNSLVSGIVFRRNYLICLCCLFFI